jgi:Family of unknown function (DUF6234)
MEDDIQDAVPVALPERLPVPFRYAEPRPRPHRGTTIALVLAVDLLVALLGGLFTFMISFQGFADNGNLLARKQASQTELLGGVALAILVIAAACAFWAKAYLTVMVQVVAIVAVLICTTLAVHKYSRLFPYDGTPNDQPTATSTYSPCYSGSGDCN